MYIENNIRYGGDDQVFDVYRPFNGNNWPVVMSVHGGGWTIGDEDSGPTLKHALTLVEKGFMVVSVRYRMAPKYPWPWPWYDMLEAYKFLKDYSKYKNRIGKIGLIGASAGAHISAQFALPVGLPSCLLYGPYNLETWKVENNDIASQFLPGAFGNHNLRSTGISPYYRIDVVSKIPNMLVIHGTKDEYVNINQSINFVNKINKKQPGTAKFVSVNGGNHCFRNNNMNPSINSINNMIANFFKLNLIP